MRDGLSSAQREFPQPSTGARLVRHLAGPIDSRPVERSSMTCHTKLVQTDIGSIKRCGGCSDLFLSIRAGRCDARSSVLVRNETGTLMPSALRDSEAKFFLSEGGALGVFFVVPVAKLVGGPGDAAPSITQTRSKGADFKVRLVSCISTISQGRARCVWIGRLYVMCGQLEVKPIFASK